jgi:hypothetical protein
MTTEIPRERWVCFVWTRGHRSQVFFQADLLDLFHRLAGEHRLIKLGIANVP